MAFSLTRLPRFFIGFFLPAVFLLPAWASQGPVPGPVLETKSLKRWPDPVVMGGGLVPEMLGRPLSGLRLYAWRQGALEPIRYQIDEMTEDGDWILPEGPRANGGQGNRKLDIWDKLVFMADDTGDRVRQEAWDPVPAVGEEILVTDPASGEKGWCYLFFFEDDVPQRSGKPDYVRYDYQREVLETDYYRVHFLVTKEGRHTTYYQDMSIPEAAGGNARSFVDRLKVRVEMRALFGLIPIRVNEEELKSDVLAYKVGPIRRIGRLEQYVRLPGGIRALYVITDVTHYRNVATVPVIWNIPIKLDKVLTSAVVRFGTDHNRNAVGAVIRNSMNPEGFLVDGRLSGQEKAFDPGFDRWRLITGDPGTFMTRTILSPGIREGIRIPMGLEDRVQDPDPPERIPGSIGYLWQDWDITGLPRGKHVLYLEFYWIPDYRPGNEIDYLKYIDEPLKITAGEQTAASQVIVQPNLDASYAAPASP